MKDSLKKPLVFAIAASMAATFAAGTEKVEVDSKIKSYAKTSGVTGNLNSIGSDTLNNLMALWAEGFKAIYPNVNIQVEGKGSGTAPPPCLA